VVGIVVTRRRRVTGLRREELAKLAKISVPYYTRLEQGKHATASHSVLESIATVLQLPPGDRAYLHQLATSGDVLHSPEAPEVTVGPETIRLLDALGGAPALVLGPNMDLVATNAAARSFCRDSDGSRGDRLNAIRWQLFHPDARRLFGEDWAPVTAELIGMLRLRAGRDPAYPGMQRLIREAAAHNELFRQVWGEQKVSVGLRRALRMTRPGGGTSEMLVETLTVNFATAQTVIVFLPSPT
jgi:transcriptional regulator with XRE-family HTH domain